MSIEDEFVKFRHLTALSDLTKEALASAQSRIEAIEEFQRVQLLLTQHVAASLGMKEEKFRELLGACVEEDRKAMEEVRTHGG